LQSFKIENPTNSQASRETISQLASRLMMQRAVIPILLLSLCVLATCEKLPPSGVTHASYGAPDLTAPRRRLEAEAKGAAQGGGRIAYVSAPNWKHSWKHKYFAAFILYDVKVQAKT
jgi:hypothetical protein